MVKAISLLFPLCLFAVAKALSLNHQDYPKQGHVIDLGYAQYQGTRLGNGVDQYLGIRYAKAPLGELRFRAPEDPAVDRSIQDATKFGPVCVGIGETVDAGHAEDCLFVNVFKPSRATVTSKLPVWVYIHGGGFALNSNPNYNGSGVVEQSGHGIIFVNFNYRVGALGFLASEDVRRDGHLNAGLLDQRFLLHWVEKNIAKFGGDPDHVVIHGASAGAGSVVHHLTAYGAKRRERLFVGAIAESPYSPTQRTVSEMQFQYDGLLRAAGCSTLNCLRGIGIETFLAISQISAFPGAASNDPLPVEYWLPVVDGTLIVDRTQSLLDAGHFHHVPLLVGDDTNEGSYFAYNASTAEDMTKFIKNNYPQLTATQLQRISHLYPIQEPVPLHAAYFPSASAVFGDFAFTCPGNRITSAMARDFNPENVWNYRFNVQDQVTVASGLGVPHLLETSAIFGPGYVNQPVVFYSSANAPILPITSQYFISFVQKLNPNAIKVRAAPVWKAWDTGSGQRLRLQTNNTAMETVPSDLIDKCRLWETLAGTLQI